MMPEPRFWSSSCGRIIRSIVLDGNYTREKILEKTHLDKDKFDTLLDELFRVGLIEQKDGNRLCINSSKLYIEYKNYWMNVQRDQISFVNKWISQERIEAKANHFFLEDRLLDRFFEDMLENARAEVLVTTPYAEECSISNSLVLMSQKGIDVELVTRKPTEQHHQNEEKRRCLSKLEKAGIFIVYDESIHAKLIVIDRTVAVVSSMNFVTNSSGGACWEAGMATFDANIVQSIRRSVMNRANSGTISQETEMQIHLNQVVKH